MIIWIYNNRKKRDRNSSPENTNLADLGEESGTNLLNRPNTNSDSRLEGTAMSQSEARSSTSPIERDALEEESQLPPKYEDIENHPIVTQHSISITDTENPPPKYEDIL